MNTNEMKKTTQIMPAVGYRLIWMGHTDTPQTLWRCPIIAFGVEEIWREGVLRETSISPIVDVGGYLDYDHDWDHIATPNETDEEVLAKLARHAPDLIWGDYSTAIVPSANELAGTSAPGTTVTHPGICGPKGNICKSK